MKNAAVDVLPKFESARLADEYYAQVYHAPIVV
jgi:hypothetical protein